MTAVSGHVLYKNAARHRQSMQLLSNCISTRKKSVRRVLWRSPHRGLEAGEKRTRLGQRRVRRAGTAGLAQARARRAQLSPLNSMLSSSLLARCSPRCLPSFAAPAFRRHYAAAAAPSLQRLTVHQQPAFTSLAFSLAFAALVLVEYARYFALYPVGANLHLFFSEFVDSKDTGPVRASP